MTVVDLRLCLWSTCHPSNLTAVNAHSSALAQWRGTICMMYVWPYQIHATPDESLSVYAYSYHLCLANYGQTWCHPQNRKCHDVSQWCHNRNKPRPQATCTETSDFQVCFGTDMQTFTYRQTCSSQSGVRPRVL